MKNLQRLQIYADVISTGSFTAAAELHGVTQPAVSFHVRQLEQEFGVALVARSGRRAIPSAAGATLLRHIARIEQAVDDTMREMGEFAARDAAPLRIGSGSTACATLLPDVLRLAQRSLPRAEFSVATGATPEIARRLLADEIDVGLVTLPIRERQLIGTPLFRDEVVVLAPTAFSLPEKVTPTQLESHTAMVFESARVTRSLIDGWFSEAGKRFHPEMAVGSIEAIRELVAMGMGYAIVPKLAIAQSSLPGSVTMHHLQPALHRMIGVARRRNAIANSSVEIFIAALRRKIDAVIEPEDILRD